MQIRSALPKRALSFTAALLLCGVSAAAASFGVGTVTAGSLRLRAEASTSSKILLSVPKNAAVVVLDDKAGGWYHVSYGSSTGYMYADYLSVATAAETELGYGRVEASGSVLRLRSAPGGTILSNIPHNTALKLEGLSDGWYKVTYGGKTGYVSSDYIVLTDAVSASTSEEAEVASAAASSSAIGSDIVAYAKNFLGCKYVYGANGPNTFDCSGFTKYIMAHFGYTLNRTASAQLSNGSSVSCSNLQPGDLVFFKNNTSKAASHVGIYVGSGKFIHASSTGRTVMISSLSSGWYKGIYVGARRIAQ